MMTSDDKVGGWVKKGQNHDDVILECPLSLIWSKSVDFSNSEEVTTRSHHENYFFLNLEIIENSNFNLLPNKLNFCCGNYSREKTNQG